MKNRIKECREKLKMSQEELAEKSGVSRTTIANFEAEQIKRTTNTTMEKISKALGKSIKYVFYL